MQNITKIMLRPNLRQLRGISRCASLHAEPQPAATPEKLEIPPPSNVERPVSAKLEKLATEISQLNLIEVSELSGLLKRRLNLPDAPVMPIGGFAAPQAKEEEDDTPKAVKSVFNVKLMKYDDKQKVAIIKEVKALMEGMNLVQAKKFVEGSPAVLKTDVSKDEAEKLRAALEKVGGVVEID